MKEGAVALSEEGVVLYGNRRLGEILDAQVEKIVGSNIKRFISDNELEKFETLLRSTGEKESTVRNSRFAFAVGMHGAV